MIGGALLVAFAPTPDKYWSMVVPALILTALGVASGFVAAKYVDASLLFPITFY